MSTHLNAHLVPPARLMDQVDIFLNIAEDSVDSEFDSGFDDFRPEILHRTIPDFGARSKARASALSRLPAKRSRGLSEVAAEVSRF